MIRVEEVQLLTLPIPFMITCHQDLLGTPCAKVLEVCRSHLTDSLHACFVGSRIPFYIKIVWPLGVCKSSILPTAIFVTVSLRQRTSQAFAYTRWSYTNLGGVV